MNKQKRKENLAYGLLVATLQTHQGSYMIKNPNDLQTRKLTKIKDICLEGKTLKINGENFEFESDTSQIIIIKYGPKPELPYSPFYEIDLMQKDEKNQYKIILRNKKYLSTKRITSKTQ